VGGVRNLKQIEALDRARLLDVQRYDIDLDLTDGTGGPGDGTFRSVTTVHFTCAEPGGSTFIEAAASKLRAATLNGKPLDITGWSAETGLILPDLAGENVLIVDGDFPYSTTGQGLHRSLDPVDKEVYLYSQFEAADAQRAFACFDQPDLKSVYMFHTTVPAHWKVISNSPVASVDSGEIAGTKVVHFAETVKMSTYITAVCAGPYHEVRDSHDGIDLGLFCRTSMARYLDSDDLFLITKQGFDWFNTQFGVKYPLPKYDQVWVPDFNAGAMENFGCVTHGEQYYLFRSKVTNAEYEGRANTILHEMAHMWFGDMVTMRWWDDLWLNESFAEWAAYWCASNATRFDSSWTAFLSQRKNWGYRQDQLSSTHPVYCEIPDVEAVESNFDGITYAKGASILKQLVAYVGQDTFVGGLRTYFRTHAWGNATFDDLLGALEAASGKELRKFAAQWLETAQVNTLRPLVEIGPDGTYTGVVVEQTAPSEYPTLRTHRIGVGLYDLDGDRLVRRQLIEVDIEGARTELPQLVGSKAPTILLLNDEDLTYTKLRLDPTSMQGVIEHIAKLPGSLPRALCWAAAWDMVRDGELAGRDYVRLICNGLPSETDMSLVAPILGQARGTLNTFVDPAWAATGRQQLADTAKQVVASAEPGSGQQLAWSRAFIAAARSEEDLATLRGWLSGQNVPAGLPIDTEVRWGLIQALIANGKADESMIEAELDNDRTASGERQATIARALIPTEANKDATWRQLTGPDPLPNWQQRAMLIGFRHPSQLALTEPYTTKYFAVLDHIWATRDNEPASEFIEELYPFDQVSPETVELTEAWRAQDGHHAAVRRLVAEGRDGVVRALRARAKDAESR
jgi:aminopeptidase N